MKKIIGVLILLLTTVAIYPQSVLTMDEAISKTMQNNYGIQMSKNNTKISENNTNAGNAGLLPKVDITGGMNYADNTLKRETGDIDQQFTNNSVGIGLSYTLFDGMGSIYNFRKLKSQNEGSQLNEKLFIENTLSQLYNVYYRVAVEQENLKISTEMLEISSDRLKRVEVKKKFGRSTSLDYLNAEVDYNNDSINFLNTQQRYNESKRDLSVIMGNTAWIDFVVVTDVKFLNQYSLEVLKNNAFEFNTSHLLSKNGIKTAGIDLKIAKSTAAPRLTFQSSYGYSQQSENMALNYNNPDVNFSAGLNLSFNLFDGGIKKTQRQNAKIRLDNSQLSVEEDKLDLDREVENAYASFNNSQLVLQTEKRNLASAQLNFDQSAEYFKLGQISSTQFRDAQLNLNRAKTSISSALFSSKLAEIELVRLTGSLVKEL